MRSFLMHLDVENEEAVSAIAARIVMVANDGSTDREFRRWVNDPSVPYLRSLSPEWLDVLFRTTLFTVYSGSDNDDIGSLFEYLKIDAWGCPLPFHKVLDGFCSTSDNAIWEEIKKPPFDWLCGCRIFPEMERRRTIEPRPSVQIILQKAKNWKSFSPKEVLIRL